MAILLNGGIGMYKITICNEKNMRTEKLETLEDLLIYVRMWRTAYGKPRSFMVVRINEKR